jgi:hypothetical protein
MPHSPISLSEFIARWKESGAAERANCQLFLGELCDVLGVERPRPAQADDEQNAYVFERAVTFHNPDGTNSPGRIDLYKRGCFVLEAKQGSDSAQASAPLFGEAAESPSRGRTRKGTAVRGTRGWDVAMQAARGQAERYVRALPASEGNPPFVVVVDVGHSFELYSDFSRAGKTYVPFPDARTHRILLEDLEGEEVRERLRLVWTEPAALDPSRRSARVTREVAGQLAVLARSLEERGFAAERVANFLMRAIFTMFAEDVRLIPEGSFTEALANVKRSGVEIFPDEIGSLWATMRTGGYTSVLKRRIIQFNGGLFEESEALPLDEAQLDLLMEASRADWKDVEPAIFGTLLERALNPRERHKLGAHYTPRAYVERLVMPTIIEPLRQEWADVLVAADVLDKDGKQEKAAEEVKAFHRRLCRVRVLDPACGSGNFLYVTLEHLKRLEGEVLDALHGFGESQGVLEDTGLTVDPHQLLGIEVNPRAAAITDLVLWIGYLQWHFRTRGEALPPEPVIKRFHNIECRDAVLEYEGVEEVRDESGQTVTRWDGRTMKRHPVTGEEVPDETARTPLLRYLNPRKAEWPEADFIIGNPPFIGNAGPCLRPPTAPRRPRRRRLRRLRLALSTLRRRHPRTPRPPQRRARRRGALRHGALAPPRIPETRRGRRRRLRRRVQSGHPRRRPSGATAVAQVHPRTGARRPAGARLAARRRHPPAGRRRLPTRQRCARRRTPPDARLARTGARSLRRPLRPLARRSPSQHTGSPRLHHLFCSAGEANSASTCLTQASFSPDTLLFTGAFGYQYRISPSPARLRKSR